MADASSIRKAATLPTPTNRNKGSIRYNTTTNYPVVSDGNQWISFNAVGDVGIGQAVYSELLNADIATKPFYIVGTSARVIKISVVAATVGTVAGATVVVTKETGTQAPGTGVALNTAVNVSTLATASTVQEATLSAVTSDLLLSPEDRLSVLFAGTLTTLDGIAVTVELEYFNSRQYDIALPNYLNSDVITTPFYVANKSVQVVAVREVHTVLGTNASAVSLTVTKETGTTAPGSGTALLTSVLSLKAPINTVQDGVLTTAAPTALVLSKGDRLSTLIAGTTTAVAGVVTTVTMKVLPDTAAVIYNSDAVTAAGTDQVFYIAPRPAIITAIAESHRVLAGGTGATGAYLAVVKDTGTDAPGGGTDVLTGGGFDLSGAANTVQFATLATTPATLTLNTGDRLSVDYAGTNGGEAGVAVTVELQYL